MAEKQKRAEGGGSDGSSPILRQLLAALARLYATTVTLLCCTTASVGPRDRHVRSADARRKSTYWFDSI